MNYWLLTTEYPPLYGGGIATYCYYTAKMMQCNGHNVTVFIYDLSLSEDKIEVVDNIRVVRFVPRKTDVHQFLGFNAYISYEYGNIVKQFILKEGTPDIIESQEYHGIAYYLQQFKLLRYQEFADLNIVITCHAPSFLCLEYNHFPVYQFPEYWTGHMERTVINSADLLISPSRFFVEEAKKRIPWSEIQEQYLPNPIEIPTTQDVLFSYEENYIVCFGKLSPLKGTFELLSYFDKLWSNDFPHPLHIIGGTQQIFHAEGLTMEEIVKKKWGKYIENGLLLLKGEFSPVEAKKQLEKAHIILIPSIFDNFPYTVLEAMSIGKVVLASTNGGQTEMITEGEDGFLFDHYKKSEFENKLLHILSLNPDQLKKIGAKAIEKVKNNFSPEVIYKRKIKLLEEYLHQKKKRINFPLLVSADIPGNKSGTEQDDLLSIVIPYFNMELYIEECITSVLKAEYHNKEIIIINDGSTNQKAIEKLSAIEKNYPVKVYHKENEGLSIARNYGADCAQGQYLAFLDADDTVEKTYYSKAIKVLTNYNNIHFIGSWIQYFGDSRNCWPAFNPEPPYLLTHNMVNSSALVYKKKSFLQAGQNDPKLIYGMEDWESVISMIKNGFYGVVLPELLFNYRIRKDSMARAFTKTKRLYLNQLIAAKHHDYYAKYAAAITGILNANGSGIDFDNPTFETNSGSVFPLNAIFKERLKEKIKQNRHVRKIAYKIYKRIKN